MKALFMDCNKYAAEKEKGAEAMKNCLLTLITVETQDKENHIKKIVKDIKKTAKIYNKNNLVIAPFSHLSYNLKQHDNVFDFITKISKNLSKDYNVLTSEFNAEKGLSLDIQRGKENIKFRHY